MNELNGFGGDLKNIPVVWMMAAAIAAGSTVGIAGGTRAEAAQRFPSLMTTVAFPGPGSIALPMPSRGPWVMLVAYEGYVLGRHAWPKYDAPRAVSKAYEAARQAVGSAVSFGKSAATTMTLVTLQGVQAARSKAAAIHRWLRE